MERTIIKNKKYSLKNKSGFAILYAVAVSSIILAITLSILNTGLREIVFSTSVKDANDAFYAVDTATECALYYDSALNPARNAFTGTSLMSCAGNPVTVTPTGIPYKWTLKISQLGSSLKSCAEVLVDKSGTGTSITAVGYNNGGDFPNTCTPTETSVQRSIILNY